MSKLLLALAFSTVASGTTLALMLATVASGTTLALMLATVGCGTTLTAVDRESLEGSVALNKAAYCALEAEPPCPCAGDAGTGSRPRALIRGAYVGTERVLRRATPDAGLPDGGPITCP